MTDNEWLSVQDRLPENGQSIVVIGIPSGMSEPVEAEIRYWDTVGLIANITHWKPKMTDSYQKIISDMLWAAEMYCDGSDVRRFAERLKALQAQPVAWMNSYQYNDFLNGHQQFHANPHKYEQYDIPLIRAD